MVFRNHRGRRGAAVLIAVFVSLLIGAFLLFFMQDRVSFSQRMNKWDLQREQARQVVMDALHGARQALSREAARPGTAAFEAFHGGTAGTIAVALPQLEAWARELSMDVKVEAEILGAAPLDRLPYETGGVMRVTCDLSYGSMIKRHLSGTADYEFKVTSLAPPRPFGALTLACANGEEVVGDRPLQPLVRASLALRNLVEMLETALQEMPEGPATGDVRRSMEEALAGLRTEADRPELARWADHPVARGESFTVLINGREARAGQEEVEVAFLQLEKKLEAISGKLEDAERRFDDVSSDFHRSVSGLRGLAAGINPTLPGKGRALVEAARELGRCHAAAAAQVIELAGRVIFLTGDERETWLTEQFSRLTPEYWARRAAYRAASVEELVRLPVRDGVFALEGDQVLDGVSLSGRRILVVNGDARIRNLRREAGAPGANLLTLVVHGDVTLEGEVDASILVMPSEDSSRARVRVEPGTRVHGCVALGVAAELDGRGWLIRKDPWTDAGGFGAPMLNDRHQVMIAPEPRQRRIEEP